MTVNGNETRRMTKKIARVTVSNEQVIRIVPRDERTILIVGLSPGVSTVTLTDEDGKQDTFNVAVVQFDIQQLRNVLQSAVPSASVTPIPAGVNGVILRGTVDRPEDLVVLERAAQNVVGGVQIINALRVGGVQQVQLDVVVALVSRNEVRNMAFNFLLSGPQAFFGSTVGQALTLQPGTPIGLGSPSLSTGGVLAAAPGAPGGQQTNLLFGVLKSNSGYLQFLQALRNEGVVKLMAEPKLVTMSGRQASFLSGGEQAIPVPAGLGQVGVQFEEFGTRLNFVPVVLGNGRIHLEVEPEVSNLDATAGTSIQGTIVPGRITQRARTTVELEAGQTFVIGGLIQHTVVGNTSKVPLLGDLPFVGAFFSSKSFTEAEQELIILVTPHLVDPLACDQFPKCLPGQETRSPDDFELFLEGILEAPRGPRPVCQDKHYVPAYKNGPTAGLFPCAENGTCGLRSRHGCANGNCAAGTEVAPGHVSTSQPIPVPQAVSIREAEPVSVPSQPLPPVQPSTEASEPAPGMNPAGHPEQ